MSTYKNTIQNQLLENVFNKPLVVKFLSKFLEEETVESYDLMKISLEASNKLCNSFAKELGLNNSRILGALVEGVVFYDSSKGDKNTFSNYKEKKINENHMSRAAIREAVDSEDGIGWESKYSSTVGDFENYVAIRVGNSKHDGVAVIRLSFA